MRDEQARNGGVTRRQGESGAVPRHVAVIMDGNGRWATRRGLPRAVGHRAGARAVRRIVESARRRGIATLTLFAFSADNWRRPAAEVEALMRLFERYLAREARRCMENGIRLRVIGRRDRLGVPLVRAIVAAEESTTDGEAMELRIAVDYSGRDAILEAVALLPREAPPTREAVLLALLHPERPLEPPDDLLVVSGITKRLQVGTVVVAGAADAETHRVVDLGWAGFAIDEVVEAVELITHLHGVDLGIGLGKVGVEGHG